MRKYFSIFHGFIFGSSLALSACSSTNLIPPAPIATLPEQTKAPAPNPAPSENPSAPALTPEKLLGMNPKAIQQVFGIADLVNRDGRAQAMVYRSDFCILKFDFFEAETDKNFKLEHISAHSPKANPIETYLCLTHHYEKQHPAASTVIP